MIPIDYFVGLSVLMFVVGIAGVLLRRNALVVFMSLELILNAANLLFVAFAAYYELLAGQLFVFFVMTVAAAEVAVGLALIVEIFRAKKSIDVDQMSSMKG
ncbi:MAG: NADH-quinone oxidoreductase subunit NuoK [Anaerolineaceae bacterium]|nr:NADH-quinone oxidoreductase subunit NuoK [Anaerolineaceae bacterium]